MDDLQFEELLKSIDSAVDEEYIFCIQHRLKKEFQRQLLIDFIKNGKNVCYENVILASLDIDRGVYDPNVEYAKENNGALYDWNNNRRDTE